MQITMTETTLNKIASYSRDVRKSETLEGLMDYYGLKYGLQRRYEKGLAEAARTREKVTCAHRADEPPDVRGLVHIEEVALYQILETVNIACQVLHHRRHCLTPCLSFAP